MVSAFALSGFGGIPSAFALWGFGGIPFALKATALEQRRDLAA